ncbi:MAG: hypothetical protein CMO81_05615 [Waddliaceae bacterium]|nr:hypothetical protein [Waddliaceae bacterium]
MKINPSETLNTVQKEIGDYLDQHPIVNTVVLIANHIFRCASMAALMLYMPTPLPVTLALGFTASLAYRFTIERFCQYRFAIPSYLGAQAWIVSGESAIEVITGTALRSISSAATALLQCVPLVLYGLSITIQSYTAAQKNSSRVNCCHTSSSCIA